MGCRVCLVKRMAEVQDGTMSMIDTLSSARCLFVARIPCAIAMIFGVINFSVMITFRSCASRFFSACAEFLF